MIFTSTPFKAIVPCALPSADAEITASPVVLKTVASTAMSLALAVIPSPPTTLIVLVDEMSPPPVRPSPAVMLTDVWSICSLATKFVVAS